jgi:hypothetical protein
MGVGVVPVVVVVLVVVLHRIVAVLVGVVAAQHQAHPAAAITSASTSRPATGSANAVQASPAPMNGAAANTSWPRAAPRSRAPETHSVMDTP